MGRWKRLGRYEFLYVQVEDCLCKTMDIYITFITLIKRYKREFNSSRLSTFYKHVNTPQISFFDPREIKSN